jgi:hypothetical protein
MCVAPNVSNSGFVFHGIRASLDLTSRMPRQPSHEPAHREFVRALETARGRLAVAMAMESKTTPPDRWRYYRETEDRMRRYLKKLRSDRRSELEERVDLLELARALKRLPFTPDHSVARHGEAHQLCQKLREILAPLEQLETESS